MSVLNKPLGQQAPEYYTNGWRKKFNGLLLLLYWETDEHGEYIMRVFRHKKTGIKCIEYYGKEA